MQNKVKNFYTLIAREVTTDSNDGMVSIIKIIDKFNFSYKSEVLDKENVTLGKDLVTMPANYAVATSWHFGEKLSKETNVIFRLKIIDPSGKDLGGPEQNQNLPLGVDKINMNFNLSGLPVSVVGEYTLYSEVVSSNNKVLATGKYLYTVELSEAK